ncbi:MAG: 50S ribosomal protein L5 [Candidatus Yanofskybacteria bacterium CG10_big_fil_rev_8_21_14_0_10_36_16]|uniref:Large ribosomal subunit protein uL5 n=1 Tax=Candidatus Yanofskybacteria bacterium CG10_big_fil_rev_8_21_14_0_10_36_16 TaxID=1975096 RepID=A0A2J0Q8B5_9BACT|nr:MAG: 50S ribosomal protein L5 [Candidatus Yanofskybacteria bacterium CG10_big_fil_rev_8_21_14_0_10_36_16]
MNEPRLLKKYRKDVIPSMKEKFGYKNVMAIPKLEKVVVSVGIGKASVLKDNKKIEKIKEDIAKITGQKPADRKSKKSISGFKVREGMNVGVMVTLRGKRMYDFIDRLISIALPRARDFRGLNPKSFDKKGNLNIGIKEHNIFPEVSYETLKDLFSFQVTVATTSNTREEGEELLRLIGFPIKAVS